jgi:hypothetical protein
MNTNRRRARPFRKPILTGGVLLAAAVAACAGDGGPPGRQAEPDDAVGIGHVAQPITTSGGPVGLALEIENGQGVPLRIRRGQTFYLNQIDLRASLDAAVDEGVSGLSQTGDFKDLSWAGTQLADQEFVLLPNANGTYTRRRFYRDASWMDKRSNVTVQARDAAGAPLGSPMTFEAGANSERRPSDDFFDRRFRAIQWTYDCPTASNCSGAHAFAEEALVELRNAMHPERTFVLSPLAASLEVSWSAPGAHSYQVPVTQIESPAYA